MTGRTISVRAQWALHGKVLDDEGYRVIACSSGDLSRTNFADAVGRFALGALDTLPQVSASYLQPAATGPGGGYLALAIHWFAADGQRYADGALQFDNQGRHTAFTSYFCVPYATLAAQGITYHDMYRAFSSVTLPMTDGLPRDVTIDAAARQAPGIDPLAMRVAPLLLTGVPVCVLGADETSLEERLRFIDAVMSLLPYGFRSRMTAATWTRATHRNHRFRLFFSSEPRAADRPDHLVTWGEPDKAAIPCGHAGDYFGWLSDKVTPLAGLAELNAEVGFGDSAGTQALYLVDGIRLWRRSRQRPSAPPPGPAAPPSSSPVPVPVPAEPDPVEGIIRECAGHAGAPVPNLARLRSDLSLLQRHMETGTAGDDQRRRYRTLIARHGLLRPNPHIGKYEARLYDTLLRLAFGAPVGYEAFCQAEDALRNPPSLRPHPSLLEAMDRAGLAGTQAKVIVYSCLDPRKLAKWLGSKEVDAYGLIGELGTARWHRREHGRLFCDALLQYLRDKQGRYSTAELRRALQSSGYLAQPLRRIGHEQYQVYALTRLLVAAFPQDQFPHGIGEDTVTSILAGAGAPTPALLAAVLRKIPVSEAPAAWAAYVHGSIAGMDLESPTHAELLPRLPAIEPASPAVAD